MTSQSTVFSLLDFLEEHDNSLKHDSVKSAYLKRLRKEAEEFQVSMSELSELESWASEVNDEGPQLVDIYELIGEI